MMLLLQQHPLTFVMVRFNCTVAVLTKPNPMQHAQAMEGRAQLMKTAALAAPALAAPAASVRTCHLLLPS